MSKYIKFLFLFALTTHSASVFSMSRAVLGRRLFAAVAVASAAKVGMSHAGWNNKYTRTENKTLPLRNELYIKGIAGAIAIRGAQRNDIDLTAVVSAYDEKGLENTRIKSDYDSERVTVETVVEGERGGMFTSLFGRNATNSFTNSFGNNVTISGRGVVVMNGHVIINGASGGSVDYTVTVPHGIRFVNVKNSSGDVYLEHVDGRMELKSSAGVIGINGAKSAVRAKSDAGHVKVSGARNSVSAKSSAGDVRVECEHLPDDAVVELSTSAGNNTIIIPRDSNATVSATASCGKSSSDFSSLKHESPFSHVSSSLRGIIGRGGAQVRLKTSAGNNAVRAR